MGGDEKLQEVCGAFMGKYNIEILENSVSFYPIWRMYFRGKIVFLFIIITKEKTIDFCALEAPAYFFISDA
jgi:hypothetical protein